MTTMSTEAGCEGTAWVLPIDRSRDLATWPLAKEELDGVLRLLEAPFDVNLVQWRVTEWSDDGARGLMMAYADPRAYSDRLNCLFFPGDWTRRYTVQASAPVQRGKRGQAAKILVTCEVTIACIGTNSGTGEEWSDKENALTAAEAKDCDAVGGAFRPKRREGARGPRGRSFPSSATIASYRPVSMRH